MTTTALEYLQKLSELMLGIEVSEKDGTPRSLNEGAEKAVQHLLSVGSSGRKVMLIGNGGSAAIVSHIQNDICKAVGVRALVFTEQPLLTALANDNGYGSVYEWPVKQWAESGDLLWAISSSGRSENILRAVKAASDMGCSIVTLSGFAPDNPLRQMGDINFYVGSDVYGFVETAHAALSHVVTDAARIAINTSPKINAAV